MNDYFASDFEPFGVWEFSDDTPVTEKIFDAMSESLGPAFQQPDQAAETFADAVCYGVAQLQLEAAGAQDDPDQISYLLSDVERDYEILAPVNATLAERRAALKTAIEAHYGAITSVIFDGLEEICGDLFYYWRPMDFDEVSLDAVPPLDPYTKPIRIISLQGLTGHGIIWPGAQTVTYSRLLDDGNGISQGETLTVDPHNPGLTERVTVTAATATTITATFTKVHEINTKATTGPYPLWRSNKCHSMIVVNDSVLDNQTQINAIHAFMRKCMPASNTWAICQSTGIPPGKYVGPFDGDLNRIGQTPIAASQIEVY